MLVYSKPFIKIIGILLLTITTSKVKVFVVLLVCDLQPSTNVTKNSILGVAGILDPSVELYNMF